MPTLAHHMLSEANRPSVLADCTGLIHAEIAGKRGPFGLVVRSAFGVFDKLIPNIVSRGVNLFLDDFVRQLEPYYHRAQSVGIDVERALADQANEVAQSLFDVVDVRLKESTNTPLKKAYQKLRAPSTKHVAAAVPGMARIIKKYVD